MILPKVDELDTLAPGALKCGVFRMLKKSARNCVLMRSVTRKDFANDQSKFSVEGARITLRGLFPNVPGAAKANAEALNQALSLSAVERSVGK